MAISNFLRNAFGEVFLTMGVTEADIAEEQYELNLPKLDHDIEIQLETDGLIIGDGLENPDIMLSSPNQYFLFKQRPVLVYIRDQFLLQEKYRAHKFNPYHICFCEALKTAKKQQRFQSRYVVTYNTTGRFLVNITVREKGYGGSVRVLEKKEEQYEELHVCQDCLRRLNWKNFLDYCSGEEWWRGPGWKDRMRIVDQFSIREFFGTVKKNLIYHKELYGASLAPKKVYVLTPEEKRALKMRAGQRCEKCGSFLPYEKLYIHHIDHNEGNNNSTNLMVVCMPCHQGIHRMEGGYILDD